MTSQGSSGGGSLGQTGGIASGSGISASYCIRSDLEPQTRKIMQQMGGAQPSEADWARFFPRSNSQGGGWAVDGQLYDKMQMAHNVAIAQAQAESEPAA